MFFCKVEILLPSCLEDDFLDFHKSDVKNVIGVNAYLSRDHLPRMESRDASIYQQIKKNH